MTKVLSVTEVQDRLADLERRLSQTLAELQPAPVDSQRERETLVAQIQALVHALASWEQRLAEAERDRRTLEKDYRRLQSEFLAQLAAAERRAHALEIKVLRLQNELRGRRRRGTTRYSPPRADLELNELAGADGQAAVEHEPSLAAPAAPATPPDDALRTGMRSVLAPLGAGFDRLREQLYYRYYLRRPDWEALLLLARSEYFDRAYYLAVNADVAGTGMDPLIHYVDYGAAEGRNPGPSFDSAFYLAANPDVAAARLNPLVHYLQYGIAEGRASRRAAPQVSGGKKIVVYTAIAGGYDDLKMPEVFSEHCDYVCFSDRELPGDHGWEVRPFDYLSADPRRTARYVKVHPHVYFPDYECSIWIDANLLIKKDITEFTTALSPDVPMATYLHPYRDCIYAEGEECAQREFDDADTIRTQLERYKHAGYPPNNGLNETNVLVRRHQDERVIRVMNDWWREIENGSKRDQLSLNYAAHVNEVEIGALAERGISVRNDRRFQRYMHGELSNYRPAYLSDIDAEPRAARRMHAAYTRMPRPVTPALLAPCREKSADIVICIHNGLDDVKRCLAAVHDTLSANHRLVLVDDGSDAPTRDFLDGFIAAHPEAQLIRHPQAGGYTVAANAGLRASSADYVILLNSDTVVVENWALKLIRCAEQAPDIGMVGPMSNAASWQSVPECIDERRELVVNPLPPGFDVEHMDQLLELHSTAPLYPRVNLLNGFCLCIKRKLIDSIGLLDEASFPHGYGEENDYCFRAQDAGFALAVATDTYVYHAKSRSYTHARRKALSKEGTRAFRSKYPGPRIARAVESTRFNPMLERIREAARSWFGSESASQGPAARPAVLFVLPLAPGDPAAPAMLHAARAYRARNLAASIAVPEIYRSDYQAGADRDGAPLFQAYGSAEQLVTMARDFDTVVATGVQGPALLEPIARTVPTATPIYLAREFEFGRRTNSGFVQARRFGKALEAYVRIPRAVVAAESPAIQEAIERRTGKAAFAVQPSAHPADASADMPPSGDPGGALSLLLLIERLCPGAEASTGTAEPEADRGDAGTPASGSPIERITRIAQMLPERYHYLEPELSLASITPGELAANRRFTDAMRLRGGPPAKALFVWFVPTFEHITRGTLRTVFMAAESFSKTWDTDNLFVLLGEPPDEQQRLDEQLNRACPSMKFSILYRPLDFEPADLPQADAAFCTSWTTAYALAKYNKCACKYYFLQEFEADRYPAGPVRAAIEHSCTLGFFGIANTPGVAAKLQAYDPWVSYFLPGLDRNIFFPGDIERSPEAPLRITFHAGNDGEGTAFHLGLEALRVVKEYFGEAVSISCAGVEFNPDAYGLQHTLEAVGPLNFFHEAAELYRNSDLGLIFLHGAHPSYHPLEFMATGCPLLTNFNPNNVWLFRDGFNVFYAEPSIEGVSLKLIEVLQDTETRRRVAANALATVGSMDWESGFAALRAFVEHPKPAIRPLLTELAPGDLVAAGQDGSEREAP